jgi:hypothetical protein
LKATCGKNDKKVKRTKKLNSIRNIAVLGQLGKTNREKSHLESTAPKGSFIVNS